MRAVVITEWGPPSVLRIQEVPPPSIEPGQLLVSVRAAGINRADLLQRQGLYPPPAGVRDQIPGLEFSGFVEKSLDSRFKTGDRVMGLVSGEGCAELVQVAAAHAMHIPSNLSFEEASCIPEAYLTAYDAVLLQMGLQKGESLLIHAAGSGVGTAAIQLAQHVGATTFGTVGSEEKLNKALALGLQQGFNYREEDFAAKIKALGHPGIDVILDLVGARHLQSNLRLLAPKGRMIIVGLVSGRKAEIDLGLLLSKRLTLKGTVLRSRPFQEKSALIESFSRHILTAFAEGRLKPVLDRVFDWSEVSGAHQYMEENRNFGKVVLRVR